MVIVTIIFVLIGVVMGAALLDDAGFLFGGFTGFLFARILHLSARLKKVEALLAQSEEPLRGAVSMEVPESGVSEEGDEIAAVERVFEKPPPAPGTVRDESREEPEYEWSRPNRDRSDAEIAVRQNPLVTSIIGFFTDGNVVVRGGIVVLFFGVAFLVKYAAEHSMFPIELRLAAAALGALVLTGFGWRLRARRNVYALLLQGGGIGIFYITVFGAAKLYHLLPMGLAFGLMVAIVVLSSTLALLQNSLSLAAFGVSGGFLAPILTSTGGGSHVMLFSYYALLNAGILGIAWFKAWRELNLLGFGFTFVIGAFWGMQYYTPQHFATTEPFLILFFLFYVAIAVLFALRSPLQLCGYVDGSLVFGVPVVGFALQTGLVKNIEYGLAWSALALALFYVLLATALWRRRIDGMRLLTEAFLALGVVFGTLAIPLALDGRWTAAAWALEGAAMFWIGVRQQRLLPRFFGLLLQLGAGLSFMTVVDHATGEIPVLNGVCLGSALIALAGLFSGYYLQRHAERLRKEEEAVRLLLLGWGLIWWLGGGIHEIERFVAWEYRLNSILLFIVLTAAVLLWLWHRINWRDLRYPLVLLLPSMVLLSLDIFTASRTSHFFANWGALPWLVAFVVQYRLLWRMQGVIGDRTLRFGHSATFWLLLGILTREACWLVGDLLENRGVWAEVVWALLPAAAMVWLLGPAVRLKWPVQRFADTYRGEALLPVALLLWLWCLFAAGSSGNPWPLPYVPLFNPLELAQGFVLVVLLRWSWYNRELLLTRNNYRPLRVVWIAIGLAAFVLLNEVVAHAVHYWGGVAYRPDSLFRSMLFQASISVIWTLAALSLMVLATRRGLRVLWLSGAGLLAATVAKLFIIDLSRSDNVERIVSFIAVGLLMLLIGYFSPLPPKQQEEAA